jgi:ribosomal protein S14
MPSETPKRRAICYWGSLLRSQVLMMCRLRLREIAAMPPHEPLAHLFRIVI